MFYLNQNNVGFVIEDESSLDCEALLEHGIAFINESALVTHLHNHARDDFFYVHPNLEVISSFDGSKEDDLNAYPNPTQVLIDYQ